MLRIMSKPLRLPRTWSRIAALTLVTASCQVDSTLPPATIPVAQQLITLYALTGTPVTTPSGYNMVQLGEVRTNVSNNFDFVMDIGIDSTFGVGSKGDTVIVLLPRGAVGFVEDGGLQWTITSFDSVVVAPVTGYQQAKATRIRQGDVVLAASRRQVCDNATSHPRYAKLDIQTVDLVARSVVILVVIDPNCGYRSLKSGIPIL
jgi:hypothetical protein